MTLSPALERRFASWLGEDAAARVASAQSRRAVRVQNSRVDAAELSRRVRAIGVRLESVPFAAGEAWFWGDPVEGRLAGNMWEHQAGWFYVMDAASMLAVQALDPRPGERILDLCAAPGGKSAYIADRMQGSGLLVANEMNRKRLPALADNLDRLGVTNVVLTNRNGAQTAWALPFDRILVDAPCSNLGHAHATRRVTEPPSDTHVGRLVRLQRDLLAAAFRATRPGGIIVYSTCTLDPRENEGAAAWFADTHQVELEPFDPGVGSCGLRKSAGDEFPEAVSCCRRLHPGDADTDGFFVAKFRKLAVAAEARVKSSRPTTVHARADSAWKEARGQWGLTGVPDDASAVGTDKRLFVAAGFDLAEALSLDPARIGAAFGVWDMRAWRLTFDAATSHGHGARDAIEVSQPEARALVAGRAVARAGAPRGEPWRVLTVDGEPIGTSRLMGGELPSFTPRFRRVPEEGAEHWGRFAKGAAQTS